MTVHPRIRTAISLSQIYDKRDGPGGTAGDRIDSLRGVREPAARSTAQGATPYTVHGSSKWDMRRNANEPGGLLARWIRHQIYRGRPGTLSSSGRSGGVSTRPPDSSVYPTSSFHVL
ncbi:hypothetical protein V495_02880 [Pseudogymnoascus sp. VKM F-4514 (FW-929)]|nr:hypothetical protein V495_02880 [Pseudogymnoascus sp. VKM F-4514 (FW-929)]KFY51512.1 hypothetical protein V497_09074 [Pseudogymnoascus sp. VKM F-4516 (FW-969)]